MGLGVDKQSRNGHKHPFCKKDPKPTRARLVSLLGPLGRKRYGEVERFLATITGVSSGLHYFGAELGWAVRYQLGLKTTLCILHVLPDCFEATVALCKELEGPLKSSEVSPELKRRVSRSKQQNGSRLVRLPIRNDLDYAGFQTLINLKASAVTAKKPGKPTKKTASAAK